MASGQISERARVLLKTLVECHIRDGHPVGSSTLAREAGLPAPPTRSLAEMIEAAGPMGREFLSESRRLDIRRMREELGFTPRYGDPVAGIRASLDESGPWMPDPADRASAI